MTTLVLVRHAKSDWGHPGLADHNRPLNDRGLRDAPVLAQRLAATGFRPDRLLTSTALRARTTAGFFADALGVAADAREELYGASARTLLATTSPALLVAAVVHAEIMTVAPFASHNGIVARAAERLVLVSRGVDPASVVVPESGHLTLRPQYESNLRGYAVGGQNGLHAWLLYAAQAYSTGTEASPLRD